MHLEIKKRFREVTGNKTISSSCAANNLFVSEFYAKEVILFSWITRKQYLTTQDGQAKKGQIGKPRKCFEKSLT